MKSGRAVFFDFDGTLIDSRADLCATVNHTRRDLGLPELDTAEILAHVGLGAKYLLAHSIPERSDDVDGLWRIFRSHYGEHMLESVTLYPGVSETLRKLHERGWTMGVNTAKPAFATAAILDHFDIRRYFGDAVVAGGDCSEMKPSALPLRLCAERAGHTLTENDWMVGDNWTDVECAANAGVKSAFCSFGFGTLGNSKSTVKLSGFAELLDYLQ